MKKLLIITHRGYDNAVASGVHSCLTAAQIYQKQKQSLPPSAETERASLCKCSGFLAMAWRLQCHSLDVCETE